MTISMHVLFKRVQKRCLSSILWMVSTHCWRRKTCGAEQGQVEEEGAALMEEVEEEVEEG